MIKIDIGKVNMDNKDTELEVDETKEIKEKLNKVRDDIMHENNEVCKEITLAEDTTTKASNHVQKGNKKCDSCPICRDAIIFSQCESVKVYTMQDTYLDGLGRILDVALKIKKVCPNKRIALGITIVELDEIGNEYPRGLKTITVPAHHASTCRDIPINGIRFILPEDISVGDTDNICHCRRFLARVTAHYID